MKTFKFRNAVITIETTGYGQYTLSGLGTTAHCTSSEIYDWCDDDSDSVQCSDAKRAAYKLLKNHR